MIGKFKPGPRDTVSEWQLLRHWLAATLFSRENMCDVTELIGRHYELVSILYRLLGAKVGKRVFWPGHLPVFTGEIRSSRNWGRRRLRFPICDLLYYSRFLRKGDPLRGCKCVR